MPPEYEQWQEWRNTFGSLALDGNALAQLVLRHCNGKPWNEQYEIMNEVMRGIRKEG